MPGPSKCNKIKDPKEKSDCLNYKGKYARGLKGKMGKKMGGNMDKMNKGGMSGGY